MEIHQQHQNGQILRAIKSYEELTLEERQMLRIPLTYKLEDYADFVVHYNKSGRLTLVAPKHFSKEKIAEIEANRGNDLVDMFKNIENMIEHENLDREVAGAYLKKSGFLG